MESKPIKAKHSVNDLLEDMTREDFELVYNKIKVIKLTQYIRRAVLAIITVLVGVFIFVYGIGKLDLAYPIVIILALFLGNEWGYFGFSRRLKVDLQSCQIRVVEGDLLKCYQRGNETENKTLSGICVIGEEHFKMESAEYRLASEGDHVRLEMLPTVKINIRVVVQH
jgi:hypothetical protein